MGSRSGTCFKLTLWICIQSSLKVDAYLFVRHIYRTDRISCSTFAALRIDVVGYATMQITPTQNRFPRRDPRQHVHLFSLSLLIGFRSLQRICRLREFLSSHLTNRNPFTLTYRLDGCFQYLCLPSREGRGTLFVPSSCFLIPTTVVYFVSTIVMVSLWKNVWSTPDQGSSCNGHCYELSILSQLLSVSPLSSIARYWMYFKQWTMGCWTCKQ